jgi:cytolysin-activating lysine-acyltransferase
MVQDIPVGIPASPKTMGEALGQIVWLLSQSTIHREMPIKDLEWSFMPAVLHEQFRIFRFGPLPGVSSDTLPFSKLSKESLENMPLGVAIWARLSEEAEARLEKGEHLLAADWTSGDRLWLVEMISPYATAENKLLDAMLLDLLKGPFKESRFSLHRTDPKTGRRDKLVMASHLAPLGV